MSLAARPKTWLGAHPGQSLFVWGVVVLVVGSTVVLALRGIAQPLGALAFGGLIALGEVARIRLPSDRELAPIATAGGVAYALLLAVGDDPAVHGPFQVIVVTTVAVLLGAVPHSAAGRPVRVYDMARRVLVVALAAVLFRPFMDVLSPVSTPSWATIAALVAVALVAGILEVLLAAAARAASAASRFRTVLRDELRIRAPLGAAVAATALLTATAAQVMGWTALIVCVAPLVVTQVAYRRYSGIRATYLQTIRALSQAPEVGGYVEGGHSRRVSRLAVRLGQELGLSEAALLELEYAALMHDIGQLSLRDPKPSGATVHAGPAEQRQIAELGAEIVRQTGVLDRVADIIGLQAESYDRTGRPGAVPEAPCPPLASRIIRVANAYDDLTGGVPDRDRMRAALEHIGLDEGQAYDPRVVEVLMRVHAPK